MVVKCSVLATVGTSFGTVITIGSPATTPLAEIAIWWLVAMSENVTTDCPFGTAPPLQVRESMIKYARLFYGHMP